MSSLKSKLRNREFTIGSWLSFGYTPIAEIMAKAGFEWLTIDMEHAPIDIWNAQQLIQVIELAGCVPLVRVGENSARLIKQVLDAGAHGVIVPMVNSRKEALDAMNASYYPPKGLRGVGLARAQNYGSGFSEYKKWADQESVLIVQIEHIKAVENLVEIISVDGVDGFIVGPYDLSASLGIPGQFDHPSMIEAMNEIISVMRGNKKAAGFHVVHSDPSMLAQKKEEGFSFIAYGDDMVFFSEKVSEAANELR
jgi:2-keto-3-deoxy-L-rhamnonate aldolase RhmA